MEPDHKYFICLPIDEALIIKGLTTNKALMTLNNYIDNNMGPGFNPYDDIKRSPASVFSDVNV